MEMEFILPFTLIHFFMMQFTFLNRIRWKNESFNNSLREIFRVILTNTFQIITFNKSYYKFKLV